MMEAEDCSISATAPKEGDPDSGKELSKDQAAALSKILADADLDLEELPQLDETTPAVQPEEKKNLPETAPEEEIKASPPEKLDQPIFGDFEDNIKSAPSSIKIVGECKVVSRPEATISLPPVQTGFMEERKEKRVESVRCEKVGAALANIEKDGKYQNQLQKEPLSHVKTVEPASPLPTTSLNLFAQVRGLEAEEQRKERKPCQQTVVLKGLSKPSLPNDRSLKCEDYMMLNLNDKSHFACTLRFGLELYREEIKGLLVGSARVARESQFLAFAEGFLKKGLKKHLERDQLDSGFNKQLMSATIEFCIEVSDYEFLFSELLMMITEYNMEPTFVAALEPFILSGRFQHVAMDHAMMMKLINHYLAQGQAEMLERILLLLNLERQDLDSLGNICAKSHMFSALISIKILEATQRNDCEYYVEPARCMYEELVSRAKARTKDMQALSAPEQDYDYNLSHKLMSYIQQCFEGSHLPAPGAAPSPSLPDVASALLVWLTSDHQGTSCIQRLMELDPRSAFNMMAPLSATPELRGMVTEELLCRLGTLARRLDSPETDSKFHFCLFLARVSVHPSSQLGVSTAEYLLRHTSAGVVGCDAAIRDMLQRCSELGEADAIRLIKAASDSPCTEVLAYLTELSKDYTKCFDMRLSGKALFPWLDHINSTIPAEDPNRATISRLISGNLDKIVLSSSHIHLDLDQTRRREGCGRCGRVAGRSAGCRCHSRKPKRRAQTSARVLGFLHPNSRARYRGGASSGRRD